MRAAAVSLVLVLAALVARPALAFEDFQGTRALSMGGATRAWALGDSALLLNPSGIMLAKAYDIEASYGYGSRLSEQFFHASIVDSTSGANIGGGIYYTYHLVDPTGATKGHGHEVGAALALPVSSAVAIGATLKWLRLEGYDDDPTAPAAPAPESSGFTGDVGLTVRPTPNLSFAVVGQNLLDNERVQAPLMLTYGGAFLPMSQLVVTLDGVTAFTRDAATGRRGTGVRAGLEATMAQRVALRAGGGTDPYQDVGYLSAGVSLVSPVGAVDAAVRGDLFPYGTGSGRAVFVGVSLRLFVHGAIPSDESQSP